MWQNGVNVLYYQTGAVEVISRGIWKWIAVLFIFSPYFFLPYMLYRSIDNKPGPFLWTASIVVIGALLMYYLVTYILQRIVQWRKSAGFPAKAVLYLFLLGFLVLRVWAVQVSFARLMHHYQEGLFISQIFAFLYALFFVIGYLNYKLGSTR
jgi:hypothetical protein